MFQGHTAPESRFLSVCQLTQQHGSTGTGQPDHRILAQQCRVGAVAALAFVFDMPLVLIPVGIIYILETLSDIIQVGYFKLTHGKRIFKMSPIHHHFEMCGWSEVKIVSVFSFITLVGVVLGGIFVYVS